MPPATAVQLKHFFGYTDMKSFSEDYKALSNDDKDELKILLGKEIEAGRWSPNKN